MLWLQVLVTDRSCEVILEVRNTLPLLRRLKSSKLNSDQFALTHEVLDKLIGFCCLVDDPTEAHSVNQHILFNQGKTHCKLPIVHAHLLSHQHINFMMSITFVLLCNVWNVHCITGILAEMFNILSQKLDVALMVKSSSSGYVSTLWNIHVSFDISRCEFEMQGWQQY